MSGWEVVNFRNRLIYLANCMFSTHKQSQKQEWHAPWSQELDVQLSSSKSSAQENAYSNAKSESGENKPLMILMCMQLAVSKEKKKIKTKNNPRILIQIKIYNILSIQLKVSSLSSIGYILKIFVYSSLATH